MATDPLPSWNDGEARQSVIDFVDRVTKEGGDDFVPPAKRVAVFDNDGTLWAEQPAYFQFLFALDLMKARVSEHPEWEYEEPYASLLGGGLKGARGWGQQALIDAVAGIHAGLTTDEFDQVVRSWLLMARHPELKRPYTDLAYQPMHELLAYMRENGFKTFVVSGTGIEFMRAYAEEVYGIPPEQVIGSTVKEKFDIRDNVPVLVKLPEVEFVDDKEGKALSIHKFIGRRPVAVFGNSDGDLPMMQWASAGGGARFCLFVHHTDGEREWAYDRRAGHGRLDEGFHEARARGWTVVDMKRDWKVIFPFETR